MQSGARHRVLSSWPSHVERFADPRPGHTTPLSRNPDVHAYIQGHAWRTPPHGKGRDAASVRGSVRRLQGQTPESPMTAVTRFLVCDSPRGHGSRRRGLQAWKRAHPAAAARPSHTPSPSSPGTLVLSARDGAGRPLPGALGPSAPPVGTRLHPCFRAVPIPACGLLPSHKPDGNPAACCLGPSHCHSKRQRPRKVTMGAKATHFSFLETLLGIGFQVHNPLLNSYWTLLPFSAITVGAVAFPPILLMGRSGSSNSRPRKKRKVVIFPHGFLGKVVIKPSTTPKETGEEPRRVYEERLVYLRWTKVIHFLPQQTETATNI